MEFYKNIKLEKVSEDTYHLIIKINEMCSQVITLKADQLEHIISSYRIAK